MAKIFGIHSKAPLVTGTAFTMTINGVTSDPSKGASPARDIAIWSRDGEYMVITYNFKNANAGTAGSGNYIFRIPAGFTINTAKMAAVTSVAGGTSGGNAGSASVITGSANARAGYVKVYDTTGLNLISGDANTSPEAVGSASAGLNGADVEYNFVARVPIVGWSANDILRISDNSKI